MKPRYFYSLARKIHPPLPKTSRESQQLLNLLTSSFRRHLDSEHPPVDPLTPDTSEANKAASTNTANSPQPTATEKHLSSILEHPLFNTVPSTLAQEGTQTRKHTVSGNIQNDPLSALDDAMASGRADSHVLHDCLKAHRSQMRDLSAVESHQAMKKSRGGSRIISWFLGADAESRKLFFGNRHTMALAMPYLAVQGMQHTVLDWLELTRTHRPALQPKHADDGSFSEFNLLYEYVAAEVKYGKGINGALSFFLRACDTSWGAQIVEPGAQAVPTYPYRPTAYYLAQWISAPEHASAAGRIKPQLFDSFHSVCLLMPNKFWSAFLPIYHPTAPSVRSSLTYIHNYKKSNRDNPDRLLRLSLQVASLCLEQKRYSAASEVVDFAKDLLPDGSTAAITAAKKQHNEPAVSASDLVANLSLA
ncbi:hypothetical protein FQN49_005014 [Arthroderma sp. PD_2]|nr:hypothetical protein FQN49_005014 [Arthroderma sp. PD_2]